MPIVAEIYWRIVIETRYQILALPVQSLITIAYDLIAFVYVDPLAPTRPALPRLPTTATAGLFLCVCHIWSLCASALRCSFSLAGAAAALMLSLFIWKLESALCVLCSVFREQLLSRDQCRKRTEAVSCYTARTRLSDEKYSLSAFFYVKFVNNPSTHVLIPSILDYTRPNSSLCTRVMVLFVQCG